METGQELSLQSSKLCKKCNIIKPLSEMVPRKDSQDGYRYLCLECRKKKDSDYWKKNAWILTKRNKNYKHRSPERYEAILCQQREYRIKNRERSLYLQAKKRAEKLSLPFNITMADIEIPNVCPLLGIQINKIPSKLNNRDNSPSLDRIIPSLGYVSGNIMVISYRANRIKNDASLEELERIAASLRAMIDRTSKRR